MTSRQAPVLFWRTNNWNSNTDDADDDFHVQEKPRDAQVDCNTYTERREREADRRT